MTVSRAMFTGLALVAFLALGTVAGYIAGHKAGRVDAEEDIEIDARQHYRRTTALLSESCLAGTKLRSAYTKRVIGHAERCRTGRINAAGDHFEQVSSVLKTICADIRKATRTAHLPRAHCSR